MADGAAPAAAAPSRAAPPASVETQIAESAAGFAAGGGHNWAAIGVIGGLHAAVIGLLLTTGAIHLGNAPPPVHVNFVEEVIQPEDQPPPPVELEPVQTEVFIPDVIVEAAPPPPPTITASPTPPAPKVVAAPTVRVSEAPVIPPDFTADQLNNPGPRYPSASRRAREQGTVMLKVLVSPDGRAQEMLVATSSGFVRLDEAAMATVKRWAFLPAKKAGKAVSAWVLVPVTFAIGPGDGGHGRGDRGRGGRGDRDDHHRGDHGPRGPEAETPGTAPEPTN
ncbi:energy transducer TonB [Sphingoaurantiacus capsulatus]|uniref:Energy transducer TonB n=1 Tax=Sphingoaurantiacus capsulatus TaxID=1771310 RepID=A0ABV7X8Z5_9SPHN